MNAAPGKITIDFLLRKISPLADPGHVKDTQARLQKLDLRQFTRTYRGKTCIVFSYKDIWPLMFPNRTANIIQLRELGHSLTRLFWERSALNGTFVFVKEVSEYESFGY